MTQLRAYAAYILLAVCSSSVTSVPLPDHRLATRHSADTSSINSAGGNHRVSLIGAVQPRRRRQAPGAATAAAGGSQTETDAVAELRSKRRQQKSDQSLKAIAKSSEVADMLALAAAADDASPAAAAVSRRPVPATPAAAAAADAAAAAAAGAGAVTASSGGSAGGNAVNVMLALGCEAEPCKHGGVCYTDAFTERGFSCRCTTGYYGDICEYDSELCLSGPCLNDGKCFRDPADKNAYKCDCTAGYYGLHCEHELTSEALEMMDPNSVKRYYNLRANPLLLQLSVAAAAIFILIICLTFFCCIEIRRHSILEKRKLLRAIGLDTEFPRISMIGIGCKLIFQCVTCRCCTLAMKTEKTVDPRTTIPLITPATAPPVPRPQHNNTLLQQQLAAHQLLLSSASRMSQMSDVLGKQQLHQLQQLEAQRAQSLARQHQLQQLQQQLRQQQQQQQQRVTPAPSQVVSSPPQHDR